MFLIFCGSLIIRNPEYIFFFFFFYLQPTSGTQGRTAMPETLGEFLTLTEEFWIDAGYKDTEIHSVLLGMLYFHYIAYYIK